MILLSLLLACGPKVPPEGSTELDVGVSGVGPVSEAPAPDGSIGPVEMPSADAPLPLGTALPFEGAPKTAAQQAFVDGEAILQEMHAAAAPKSPADSQRLAIEATEQAEAAIALFETASAEAELSLPSAARAGDAWRLAAEATRRTQPPIHVPPEGEVPFRAEVAAIAAELEAKAFDSYHVVLVSRVVDERWKAHARWAVAQLPEPPE
ncbi:MAG: hypothetical protein H6739_40330 [Alphaproteobacteria bacterium]|nr:hypothetical protein [Alphaproteobacteria bacterium]